MIMRKWDAVKKKAQAEFIERVNKGNIYTADSIWYYALVAGAHSEPPLLGQTQLEQLVNEWIDAGIARIKNWDIRRCMKLVELFPSSMPKHLHGRVPRCDYDEAGAWFLYFE